jgi:hypothetical protein
VTNELNALEKDFVNAFNENKGDHKRFAKQCTEIQADVHDLVSEKKLIRFVGLLVGIALGSAVTSIIWGLNRIDSVEERIIEVRGEARANASRGWEMAASLRRDMDKTQDHVDDLRKLHRLPTYRRPDSVGPPDED